MKKNPKKKIPKGRIYPGSNEEKNPKLIKSQAHMENGRIKPEVESHEEVGWSFQALKMNMYQLRRLMLLGNPSWFLKEKTVTSLGVVADGVAPVFKKRRIENGKSKKFKATR